MWILTVLFPGGVTLDTFLKLLSLLMGGRKDRLQGSCVSSTITKVTLPAPGCPWDSQGLIPASGPAMLPGQVAPTPSLKWRVVITGLPTHPLLLPSGPKGSLGLHKFSQDTWKIQLAPSPAKFSRTVAGVGIGLECLTLEGSFLLPSEASSRPGTSQPHPGSGAPWGGRRCLRTAEGPAELEGSAGWGRGGSVVGGGVWVEGFPPLPRQPGQGSVQYTGELWPQLGRGAGLPSGLRSGSAQNADSLLRVKVIVV